MGIVNSDDYPETFGKEICGLKISSMELIHKNPKAIIIITVGRFQTAIGHLNKACVKNKIFTWWSNGVFHMEWSNPLNVSKAQLLSLYDANDTETCDIIDIETQLAAGLCNIQPVEILEKYSVNTVYWNDADMSIYSEESITICDVGAYVGDSVIDFVSRFGKRIKKYYAFEPDCDNFSQLCKTISTVRDVAFETYNIGIGENDSQTYFHSDKNFSHFSNVQSDSIIPIKKLDNYRFSADGKLCIKMNIEGFELKALKGAAATIKRHKPNLAICIYHLQDDIYSIPAFLKSLVPEYRFIIRGGGRKVCYASVRA